MTVALKSLCVVLAGCCLAASVWFAINCPRLVRSPYYDSDGHYVGSVDFRDAGDLRLFHYHQGEERRRFERVFTGSGKSDAAMMVAVFFLLLYVATDVVSRKRIRIEQSPRADVEDDAADA